MFSKFKPPTTNFVVKSGFDIVEVFRENRVVDGKNAMYNYKFGDFKHLKNG